jgi:hypothetical protein
MNELISRITNDANISEEQAAIALQTVKEYIVEKFPMLAGAVDNLFQSNSTEQ